MDEYLEILLRIVFVEDYLFGRIILRFWCWTSLRRIILVSVEDYLGFLEDYLGFHFEIFRILEKDYLGFVLGLS